ncbi:MAG TPA: hypothetical protein VJ828_08070 [Lacipirellulaceae bacterium]|nr:hypothetical protein [Lacipirellulaceae bacterium]
MKPILCRQIAAMVLASVLAGPAPANNNVPFKGTIQAVETSFALFPPDVTFPTLFVDASGSGRATHLGKFTATYQLEVNLDTFFGIGSYHFIAANGDSISTDVEGQGTMPTADGVSFIVETHTITCGTGRFAGATGSLTLQRVINVFTGVTSGSFEGTIVKAK